MSRHYTAGTLNKHDKKSFDFILLSEVSGYMFDEDLELAEAKERAQRREVLHQDLREKELADLEVHLRTMVSHEFDAGTSPYTFQTDILEYEKDFEQIFIIRTTDVSRINILKYLLDFVSTMNHLKNRNVTALRVVKRLAIRLGLIQFTKHI